MQKNFLSKLLFYILAVTLPIFSWHNLGSVAEKFKHSNNKGLLDLGAVLSSNMYDVREASKIAKDYYEEISESNAKKKYENFFAERFPTHLEFQCDACGKDNLFSLSEQLSGAEQRDGGRLSASGTLATTAALFIISLGNGIYFGREIEKWSKNNSREKTLAYKRLSESKQAEYDKNERARSEFETNAIFGAIMTAVVGAALFVLGVLLVKSFKARIARGAARKLARKMKDNVIQEKAKQSNNLSFLT